MKKIVGLCIALLVLVGCGSSASDDKVITIGATPLPHADILKQLEGPLQEQGYTLKIITFDDYKIPNSEVDNGSLDANYFQHIPYLRDFNEKNGTNVVDVLKVHYEPIAIYSGTKNDLATVATGDTVLVPDDNTNLPRALKLLEELQWIRLNDNRDTATLKDIVEYLVPIEILEVKSDGIAPLMNDSAYAVLNGNYALASKVTDRALKEETISDEKIAEIVNVVAVKAGNENSPKTLAILKAFEDPAVREFVRTQFAPAVTSVLD